MGWGSGNLGGGGSGKIFAAIGVTYPEGSILTCTNGAKTLKAKTTSGRWVFAIPEAGTWIVTSTDPTGTNKPASKTVEITTEGQSVSVELSYEIILYASGVFGAPLIFGGGWETLAGGFKPSLTESADHFRVVGAPNANSGSYARFDETLDFSSHNTISIKTPMFTLANGQALNAPVLQAVDTSGTVLASVNLNQTGNDDTALDISAVGGNGYVQIAQRTVSSYGGTGFFTIEASEVVVR